MANETWWSYYDNMNNTGGGGGGVTVLTEDENGALNMTWAEIKELPFAVLKVVDDYGNAAWYPITECAHAKTYLVGFGALAFATDSPDGYPAYADDGGGDSA